MHSITEVSEELGVPYKKVVRWVREAGLGKKVGSWVIILDDSDVLVLRERAKQSLERKSYERAVA